MRCKGSVFRTTVQMFIRKNIPLPCEKLKTMDVVRLKQAQHRDARGCLSVVEVARQLPFAVGRVFWITDVPAEARRGGHAHWRCHEALYVASGGVTVVLSEPRRSGDGSGVVQIVDHVVELSPTADGVVIPAGVWCELTGFAPGTVLVVLASEPYDATGYCHDRRKWEVAIGY